MERNSSRSINPFGDAMIPGEYFLASDPIEINVGRLTRRVEVANTGDRPVQVGSHFHFFEVNRALVFDRGAAYGMRLNVASGTAVRFEPGDRREVELVAIGGVREVIGLNHLVDGALDSGAVREASRTAVDRFVSRQR
jgi:urease beta subunit